MSAKLPKSGDTHASAPVFEERRRTPFGTLHLRRFRPDAAPGCFEELAPIVALWQSRRRGEALPRWQDFDIGDFVGWHRNIALSEISGPDADPKFRICGSGVSELLGGDLTGRKISEAFPMARDDGVLDHFAAIREEKLIGLLASNIPLPGHEHRHFKAVELPLEDDAGAVGRILHCLLMVDRGA
ncbi:MAG: PAS domain-containing protein [Kiloniellaceae bacterium]